MPDCWNWLHSYVLMRSVNSSVPCTALKLTTFQLQFTKIWEGPKDDRKNIKLKVEFKYPEARPNPPTSNTSNRPSSSADAGGDAVRSRLSGGAARATSSEAAPVALSSSLSSPESIFSELQGLRKKYDAVVEYTVHLTAERDAIVAQLETSQRELVRERSRKKQAGGGDARDAQRDEATAAKKAAADKVRVMCCDCFGFTRITVSLFPGVFSVCGAVRGASLFSAGEILLVVGSTEQGKWSSPRSVGFFRLNTSSRIYLQSLNNYADLHII